MSGSCSPPYCLGTGVCGCSTCNCCPPDPCYTSYTYTYLCGTTAGAWEGEPNEGCNCAGMNLAPSALKVEFPDFNYGANDEFVFALSTTSACSIPCETLVIRLDTTGCCFAPAIDAPWHFYAIGGGIITLQVVSGSGCSDLTLVLNELGSQITVGDCDDIWPSIISPSTECCSCCLIGTYGELLNPGNAFATRIRSANGSRKISINRNALIQRMIKSRN